MEGRSYPYIGKYNDDECLVVYFDAPASGTVLQEDKYKHHVTGTYRTDWLEFNFTKIEYKECNMSTLKKGDLIIGSISKVNGEVSFAKFPAVQPNFIKARNEAERLASLDTNKKFVVCEIKGICTKDSVIWE